MADLTAGGPSAISEWVISGGMPARRGRRPIWLVPNRIGKNVVGAIVAAYAAVATPRPGRRSAGQYYHRRERFVEDAAMSREMFRL